MKANIHSAILAAACLVLLSGCASSNNLNQALRVGMSDEADEFIKNGADVNAVDNYGNTPLCNVSFVFIDLGSVSGNMGRSLANYEAKNKNKYVELARRLINKGANVNASCQHFGSPLHTAAEENYIGVAKLLLDKGAKVNLLNDRGETPLMLAYSRGYLEMADLLISRGANQSTRSEEGKTAKEYYAEYQHWKRIYDVEMERQEQARLEKVRQDKADSRAFWKGAATLATGVAVGKATSGYTPDQQARMMESSMNAVDSGDTSELTETTNQVKAEQAQSHKAKMQAIEAQKERDRAAAQRAQEDERNNQAQRRHQQSQAQPRNAPPLSVDSRGGLAETSQQDQERQRKELQAQLNAKQQSRNRNEEQLQQQAQQNNREQQSRVQPRNPPSVEAISNSGSPRNSSNQQVSNTPKQSTAATRTVTAEGDSGECFFTRDGAVKQAEVSAEIDGRKECEALGKGWGFDEERVRFPGYLGCTRCTGGSGDFRCKVTQAMYNCRHR